LKISISHVQQINKTSSFQSFDSTENPSNQKNNKLGSAVEGYYFLLALKLS